MAWMAAACTCHCKAVGVELNMKELRIALNPLVLGGLFATTPGRAHAAVKACRLPTSRSPASRT